MNLAAATGGAGTQLLGSLGLGGLALVLAITLILGTRDSSEHQFSKGVALTVGLTAGTVFIGAGLVWGMPDDLVLSALQAAGVGNGKGPLGDISMAAVALSCVVVAYLVKLAPRTAGVLGLSMASVFAVAGGAWTMISQAIADFAMGFAA